VRPDTFSYLRSLLHARSGVVLDHGKEYLIQARLGPLTRKEGLSSVDDLVALLRAHPYHPFNQRVIEALVTTETSFFRDVHPFRTLKDVLIPELIAKRRSTQNLFIWSAACSSGQEAYSIAMLLREHFPELAGWYVRILASDLSSKMVERAGYGSYSQLEINRGVPSNLLAKYFFREGVNWRVQEEVRRMVEFREINLTQALPPFPNVDIIFLRNVLIYFDEQTRLEILERLARRLKPDGYLFVGGAETMIAYTKLFKRVQINQTSCYQPRSRKGT